MRVLEVPNHSNRLAEESTRAVEPGTKVLKVENTEEDSPEPDHYWSLQRQKSGTNAGVVRKLNYREKLQA